MSLLHPRRIALLILLIAVVCVLAHEEQHVTKAAIDVSTLSVPEIEEKLQSCMIVQALNAHAAATSPPTSSLSSRLFAILFPSSSPAINSLLATLYISGPPNLLLAFCPANIDPSSLSVMVAFAVGGLLGDTLFHLLPEIFLGEGDGGGQGVRFVMVEGNRNLLLGLGILVGFVTFVGMDKGLRILTGGGGHDHGHGHAAGEVEVVREVNGKSTGVDDSPAKGTRSRKGKAENGDVKKLELVKETKEQKEKEKSASVKLGGYLNLIADATHNITDGLALSSSFYASPTLGATTAVAIFFHEIPHEVGDFALLIQSGFSKRWAMGAQFVTALGALLGTLIGIAVQELSKSGGGGNGEGGNGGGRTGGIWGTSLGWGDMLLPFTAGTFLYVGTVAVIPELLETKGDGRSELLKTAKQFLALAAGAAIMLYISWS